MISKQKFVNQSLHLNLFFLRIMKEHSIFLESAFYIKDANLMTQADAFKNEFTRLLHHTIGLSNQVIPSSVLSDNEFVTKYTPAAERATQFVTGIFIDPAITTIENLLKPGVVDKNLSTLADPVYALNQHSIRATNMLIDFKINLKNAVSSCKLATKNYPSLLDHILEEAEFFVKLLIKLQSGTEIDTKEDMIEQEAFWNDIMSEHALFIRGLLDPTEEELFNIANNFGKEFEDLTKEASKTNKSPSEMATLTKKSLDATTRLRDFKIQGVEGILGCKIKSVILPLLADHVLREANHYLNLLKSLKDI